MAAGDVLEAAMGLVHDFRVPLTMVFVVVPLLTWSAVRLVLYCLRRAATSAKVHVKKLQAKVRDGHFLDLDPEFVQRMSNNPKYCRHMSLASYLESLDYGENEITAKNMLTTLVSAAGGESLMPLLALVPGSVLPASVTGKSAGLMARFLTTEFPSILVCAAAVDVGTQVTRRVPERNDNVQVGLRLLDAMDLLARGEAAGISPKLPASMLPCWEESQKQPPREQTIALSTKRTLRDLVREEMQLPPNPDSKRYEFPRPFSPFLLPGLCRGHGGLEPTNTPRELAESRVLAVILNKLAANPMAWAGYHWSLLATDAKPDQTYVPFSVTLQGDDHDDASAAILSCGEFMRRMVELGGGSVTCFIRTNLTSFGIALCVLDDDSIFAGGQEPDETDGSKRFAYTHIPLAFCTRTGVTHPVDGGSVMQLSSHSGIEWHFKNNRLLVPDGTVGVGFYTGIEGFTGFKPTGEWARPWVEESNCIRELSFEESMRACDLAACESVCANACVREWRMPFGGYGGLGVCADSVAAVEQVLRGRTTIFPLYMRADAKCGMLYVMHEILRPKLLAFLHAAARDDDAEESPTERVVRDFLDQVNEVARALIRLPNDIQVEPQNMADSLDRIHMSTLRSPFFNDRKSHSELKCIKDGWNAIFREFEHDFAEIGGSSLKRQASNWRL